MPGALARRHPRRSPLAPVRLGPGAGAAAGAGAGRAVRHRLRRDRRGPGHRAPGAGGSRLRAQGPAGPPGPGRAEGAGAEAAAGREATGRAEAPRQRAALPCPHRAQLRRDRPPQPGGRDLLRQPLHGPHPGLRPGGSRRSQHLRLRASPRHRIHPDAARRPEAGPRHRRLGHVPHGAQGRLLALGGDDRHQPAGRARRAGHRHQPPGRHGARAGPVRAPGADPAPPKHPGEHERGGHRRRPERAVPYLQRRRPTDVRTGGGRGTLPRVAPALSPVLAGRGDAVPGRPAPPGAGDPGRIDRRDGDPRPPLPGGRQPADAGQRPTDPGRDRGRGRRGDRLP